MDIQHLEEKVLNGINELPVIDIHTHLTCGSLGARGLHDILLYHMVVTDLYSAGCKSGARLTQYPGKPSDAEAKSRIEEALPFLPQIINTSNYWGVKTILSDLYNWKEPVTKNNWKKIDAVIREKANDRKWHHYILDRLNIKRTSTEYARRENGIDDERFQYSVEWGMFTRNQWGVFDAPVYELERTWGEPVSSPAQIGGEREKPKKVIKTLDDVHSAIKHYVSVLPYKQANSMATHISTDIDFFLPTKDEMSKALKNRKNAGPQERNIYASYINELFLTELEKHADEMMFHFSFAAEPLPYETGSRINQKSLEQLAEMLARHPKIRFQCFVASRHAHQSLCTMVREIPNLSLAGYWWHNFYPNTIRQVMYDRLDMVPLNKQAGLFTDAYHVEWAYAKTTFIKKQMSIVLAEKINEGQYTYEDAIRIAKALIYETPQTLNKMIPRK